MSFKLSQDMRGALQRGDDAELERLIDQDYVTRWGRITIAVPGYLSMGMTVPHHILEYLKEDAKSQAKCMGGTIEDIDNYTVEASPSEGAYLYTWKVRRD